MIFPNHDGKDTIISQYVIVPNYDGKDILASM